MASSHISSQLSCEDYHVAWICPVANVELLPARLMLDEEYPPPLYNTDYDDNAYICGSINGHKVVIATCPQGKTGNINAGRLTAPMFTTFPNIRMTVLVGIGGGIPREHNDEKDALNNIHLGDVVVGWPTDGRLACIYHEHDAGRGSEIEGAMQNPDERILKALSILVSDYELGQESFETSLARLRHGRTRKKFAHPGLEHDRLFKSTYPHNGEKGSDCSGCGNDQIVQRPQRIKKNMRKLVFHQGRIATGNTVIRDGTLRDRISAQCRDALCVEMEAAGVDINRRCLVVRGISDYADSHKNDLWQSYAAGNAAAFTRELLLRVQPRTVRYLQGTVEVAPWLVPFPRPYSFIGREIYFDRIASRISSERSHRLAIYGLGGCGKTALALEFIYRTKEQQPSCFIFWVQAISRENFDQAYREIAKVLRIAINTEDKVDVKQLVKDKLSDENSGQWLMVVDNADDVGVLLDVSEGSNTYRLIDYLPHSCKGSIIFTTRTKKAAIDLSENNILQLGELGKAEATEVLRTRLIEEYQHQVDNSEVVNEFLETLAFLALAIVQAIAFINKNGIGLTDYVSLFKSSEKEAVALLGGGFEEQGRYQYAKNPIAITWYVSFEQLCKQDKLASDYLSFMACTENNNILASMLPQKGSVIQQVEAIGTLKAYTFITERHSRNYKDNVQTFDVHPLVHLATYGWLRAKKELDVWTEKTLERLIEILPFGDQDQKRIWTAYLPHAIHISKSDVPCDSQKQILLLDRIGCCQYTLGRYRAAELAHRQVLEEREVALGRRHPDTLTTMNDVAVALSGQAKYLDAEMMHRETLMLREQLLGAEHPDTRISRHNLAVTVCDQEKFVDAEKMIEANLMLDRTILGMKHPDILTGMNNLAQALSGQGKHSKAEKMLQEVLVLEEEALGIKDPSTLVSMQNLGLAMMEQKKYENAEEILRKALGLQMEVLGKDHPDTLTCMSNLATVLSHQGEIAEAEAIHRETLTLREKVLGPEHPDTLASVHWNAQFLRLSRQYERALSLYRRAYVGYQKTLGLSHPTTCACLADYSSLQEFCAQEPSSPNNTHLSHTSGSSSQLQSRDHRNLSARKETSKRRKRHA